MNPDWVHAQKTKNNHSNLVPFSDTTTCHWQKVAIWMVTVAWAIAIFSFSTESFASNVSETLLAHVLGKAGLTVSAPALSSLNSLTRVFAHLTEYGIFAALLYACLRRPILCVALATAYALTDEFHQLYVPGRGASLLDCALDALGAALAIAVIYAVRKRRSA